MNRKYRVDESEIEIKIEQVSNLNIYYLQDEDFEDLGSRYQSFEDPSGL